ncbi:hypothetical protein A8709_09965 [Paenibacillus pectinilyticus]|uniref:Uncharacterized protein n=1 Tax=Paenibacillus pectinilyticus TaxID=512399 RepID=A0A1C1A5V6_9BACL|nr:hypothetical protein [Paenibacillus pectinilyticus]OCT15938.1 hypothetical protein A8709_09965 [Paenibacillus pectinilyticus]
MNTPEPDDFEKDLEDGPLKQKGFTSKLQHDIENTIRQKERTKSKLRPILLFAGIGIVLTGVFVFPWQSLHTQSEAAALEGTPMEAMAVSTVPPTPISTALLIGLRTEHEPAPSGSGRVLSPLPYSTYRTMLIAPVRGQLQKTAEGTGILMPYKQNFWKIDSLTHTTNTGESHYLSAHLADQPVKPEKFVDPPDKEFNRAETLLFAGNQYISVAESEEAWDGNAPYKANRIWVRTLMQLKEARTMQFYKKPVDKNHVSIMDVYGTSVTSDLANISNLADNSFGEISGQSWTVQREPGRWVGKVAETPRAGSAAHDGYVLRDFPRELPDKVSNHDDLCCSWGNIKASWPLATDALTSPMNDMLVIFEEGKLKFYSYGQAPGSEPQLTLALQPGEQLVMAQWATDHYVQEWIDKVDRYLPAASGPVVVEDLAGARTAVR